MTSLAQSLDLANHHTNATPDEIKTLCAAVVEHGFNAAFLNPTYIPLAKTQLGGKAKIGTVISFPLGQDTMIIKVAACMEAVKAGADELDIVPNLGLFIAGDENAFLSEMKKIVTAVKNQKQETIVKFILETGYLDPLPDPSMRIKQGAKLIQTSGADFVKICSGMGRRGASLEDLKLVREAVGPDMKVKVAGGIDTYAQTKTFLDAGANRIGTSHAVEIIKEAQAFTKTKTTAP